MREDFSPRQYYGAKFFGEQCGYHEGVLRVGIRHCNVAPVGFASRVLLSINGLQMFFEIVLAIPSEIVRLTASVDAL